MTYDPVPVPLILAVIAVSIIPFTLFLVVSFRRQSITSAYLTPGFIAASIISPIVAIAIGVMRSIKFVGWAQNAKMDLVVVAFRDVNKPLIYSLVVAILLSGYATIHLKKRVPEKPPSSPKRSKVPGFFSMLALAVGIIPFTLYYRAQTLISTVAFNDKIFSGQSVESVALEISLHLISALITSALAVAITIIFLIISFLGSTRKEEVLLESQILFVHGGTLLILIGIIATLPFCVS